MDKTFLVIGAIAGFIGMVGGGLGYWLRDRLSPGMLAVFETGVRYQIYHALAIIAVGLILARLGGSLILAAGWFFIAGIVLFSGSLYSFAWTRVAKFTTITPFGGVALLIGWALLAVGVSAR